ncbi:MAG: flagellin [Phycisphaerales bacterium]|jgi:flagellin|tara:strand:+ start:4362 stop:5870 length:1509 start_codon:yes stop_codon:yes gene_type:complete
MTRINTNVSSLIAQNVLGRNNKSLGVALERLSTGLRINRGKDDPAGLIASEALRSEKAGLNAAISNADRSEQVVNIAEGGLQEVSNLLVELQGLITTSANTAGLSTEEKEANQLQIDSILQTIDRVSGSTEFQGTKLLNGNYEYQTTSVAATVTDFEVRGAKLDGTNNLSVDAVVTQSAQQAGLYLSFGGAALDLTGASSQFVFEVAGEKGSREFQFSSGDTLASIVAAVNTFTDVTGVTATVSGTTAIKLASEEYGSNEFVSVSVVDDGGSAGDGIHTYTATDFDVATTAATAAFAAASNGIRDEGQDITGTINGLTAVGQGRTMSVNSDFLDVEFSLNNTAAQALGAVAAFDITGGGADFQLASDVNIAGKVSLGIGDLSARKLGNSTDGFLDDLASGKSFNVVDGNNLDTAQSIVSDAINQVSSTRGRLGAFQKNVVGATQRSLSTALENITAAESVIRDADFAAETAALTRNQVLVSASTNVLALANQSPQNVLGLLG